MAFIGCDKLWRSEFYKSVSAKDRVQNKIPNQSKLRVNDNSEEDEKATMNFEPSNYGDVINRAALETKLSEIEGHVLYIKKD